jgi:hypothetical protein
MNGWIKNSSLPPANYLQQMEDPGELLGEILCNSFLLSSVCTTVVSRYGKSTGLVGLFTAGCRQCAPRRRRRLRGGWAGGRTRRLLASGAATAWTVRAPYAPTYLSPRSRRAAPARFQCASSPACWRRWRGMPRKSGTRACCGRGRCRPEPPACAPCGGCTGRSRGGSLGSTCRTDGSWWRPTARRRGRTCPASGRQRRRGA